MINNIVLVGRNTKAIELKQNKNGTNYVQFTLAVNRPYKDDQGGHQYGRDKTHGKRRQARGVPHTRQGFDRLRKARRVRQCSRG